MSDIHGEAKAFDRQIAERIANGHIPDLRRVQDCDYFYANPWRRKAYVDLDFGQLFSRFDTALRQHAKPEPGCPLRILEVGSGPGYLSLELARAGHDVTGIDVSTGTVAVARKYADEDPWKAERGPLRYLVDDFHTTAELVPGSFDAVLFMGALHHFPDQDGVGQRVEELLKPGGVVLVHEPTRDRISEPMIELHYLIRLLLSLGGGYYEKLPIPETQEQRDDAFYKIKKEVEFVDESGDKTQSPNDNEAGYKEMRAMLNRFDVVHEEDTYAFFHEIIGGLRFDESTNAQLARYLRDADARLVKGGVLPAYEFFFIGRKGA